MIKINVKKLIENNGIEENFSFKINQIEDVNLLGELLVFGKVIKDDGGVLVLGKIVGKEKAVCDRCLEIFEREINKDFSQRYVYQEDIDKNDYEAKAGFIIDEKNNIDLEEAVLEEIKVGEMAGNFCKNSCKGLCPGCGKNLNKTKCSCYTKKDADNPFAVLKNLNN